MGTGILLGFIEAFLDLTTFGLTILTLTLSSISSSPLSPSLLSCSFGFSSSGLSESFLLSSGSCSSSQDLGFFFIDYSGYNCFSSASSTLFILSKTYLFSRGELITNGLRLSTKSYSILSFRASRLALSTLWETSWMFFFLITFFLGPERSIYGLKGY